MFGYVVYPARRLVIEEQRLAGVTFLRVELPCRRPWRMGAAVRRAAGGMRARRVTRAVFPTDFPHQELFKRWGIEPVSDLALRREVAPETLAARLEAVGVQPERSAVAVLADGPTPQVEELLHRLAPRFRHLALWAGGREEELVRRLRWELGIALRVTEAPALFHGTQGALLLRQPPDRGALPDVALALWQGSRGDLTPYFSLPAIEGNPEPEQLLGALFAAGEIKKEDFTPRHS